METGGEGGATAVYTAIRRAILRVELKPGSELEEGALSRRYGVSRTPVREALIRLATEGLVSVTRGRGARVARLDLTELRDVFEALDLLQRAATRLAAIRRTADELDEIERQVEAFERGARALDGASANEANHALHLAIAAAAHSSRIAHAYGQVLAESLRVSHLCFSEGADAGADLVAHFERTMKEHRLMLDAIRRQDAEAAEALAGDHVRLFRSRVSATLMTTRSTEAVSASVPE